MFNDLTFRLITHDRERAEFEVALAHQWINKQEVEAAATLRIAYASKLWLDVLSPYLVFCSCAQSSGR